MIQNLYSKNTNKAGIEDKTLISDSINEKCIITTNYQNLIKTEKTIELKYTIKDRDYKRLNKGVLKVYNLSNPIEIPVGQLLGKWKKTHIGITIIKTNEKWGIDVGPVIL